MIKVLNSLRGYGRTKYAIWESERKVIGNDDDNSANNNNEAI